MKKFKLSLKEYEVAIRLLRREKLDAQEREILHNLNKRLGKIIFGESYQLN